MEHIGESGKVVGEKVVTLLGLLAYFIFSKELITIMEQEYTIATGTKIFYSIMAAAAAIAAVFFGDLIQQPGHPRGLLIIPLALLTVSVLILVNIVRRKVIIYDDSILVINLFTRKELYFKDIKGCRIEQKVIFIEPVSAAYPNIRIANYSDFGSSSEMTAAIKEKFADLDMQDLENERKDFMQNASFGATEADREAKLKQLKATAISYIVIGWVVFLLALVTDVSFFVIVAMIYPVIGIMVMLWSKGLIKFITNFKTSIYPNIFLGYMPPAIYLFIMGLDEYNAFKSKNIWLPGIILTAVMFTLIYVIDRIRIVERLRGKIVLILLMSILYGFAMTWDVNCYFDKSATKIYRAAVLNHKVQHGKSTTYYLTISPWGPEPNETEVDVGSKLYYSTPVGDTVTVKFRQGVLNIPWYKIVKN